MTKLQREQLERAAMEKLMTCLSGINNTSGSETDKNEADAVYALVRSLDILNCTLIED